MELLFPIACLMVISILLKGYYYYRFVVIEDQKIEPDNILKFMGDLNKVYLGGVSAYSLFPIFRPASTTKARDAKIYSNFFLFLFILCLLFTVGAGLLLAKEEPARVNINHLDFFLATGMKAATPLKNMF
jgi:hypothetical protein